MRRNKLGNLRFWIRLLYCRKLLRNGHNLRLWCNV
ncbi:Uncharacterised protein [Vibrio cholerae]|nr:Uncharacterised protein [Vibrio cholerae]